MQSNTPVAREVFNVVLAADIVPNFYDDTQLLQAINTLIAGGGNGGNVGSAPIGTVLSYAGATAPEGFMLCDGTELLASEHLDLFTVIGTVYGEGEAPGSFKLPDLRGRTAIGAGQGVDLTDRILGVTDGEEIHQLTVDELPEHTHEYLRHVTQVIYAPGTGRTGATSGSETHSVSSSGGDQPHNNMQPFVVLNYIIKV